jgi:hypothetical protein
MPKVGRDFHDRLQDAMTLISQTMNQYPPGSTANIRVIRTRLLLSIHNVESALWSLVLPVIQRKARRDNKKRQY